MPIVPNLQPRDEHPFGLIEVWLVQTGVCALGCRSRNGKEYRLDNIWTYMSASFMVLRVKLFVGA